MVRRPMNFAKIGGKVVVNAVERDVGSQQPGLATSVPLEVNAEYLQCKGVQNRRSHVGL
jgi:hypothetical protein